MSPELPPDLADLACARLLADDAVEQERALVDLCRQHPNHAAALRQLYRELRGADRLLQDNLSGVTADEPATIGNYRVVRRLGDGAFGVVYLCAQTVPIERQVAVKVLRPGAGNRQTLARFEAERQVLARMNHPAIAQVFDAGALPDGRPYFVMEYVDGLPITSFCEKHRLPLRERLGLFLTLCDGVQHAHQKAIIHRDLKPSNVLVGAQTAPEQAQPKIIDFGLAKVLSAAPAGAQLTEVGGVLGTPGFMSPEQAEGRHDDVDTRSDVFALGVLLYVLLTDQMPWPRGATATAATPARPSARVAARVEAGDARHRPSSHLRGDLDWIVLRALEREPQRRYQSVLELAEDLRRHLRHEPVLAGPPSTVYRLRKLVRRYRGQVVAAGVVLVALLCGLIGILNYARAARVNLQRFEILALGSRLAQARESLGRLYPPWPERLADFDAWLDKYGRPLAASLPYLQSALVELRTQSLPYTEAERELDRQRHPALAEVEKRRATIAYLDTLLAHPSMQGEERERLRAMLSQNREQALSELADLEPRCSERCTWRFASDSQQFLHDTEVRLQAELTSFCVGDACELQVVAAQRQEIVDELAQQAARAELWQRTADAIEADPRYCGLHLRPQFGLVPVGRDPDSGLQEFYHLRSGPAGGVVPVRRPDGQLDLTERSGIVFVLLPGGRALLGAQSQDPAAPGYDESAGVAEAPVHDVVLSPFFLGKHEVTQSQWWYLTDSLPSHFHKKTATRPGHELTGRHPVESVTWDECVRGLTRQGLGLPTEAQWEYACRAGTTTIWPTGDTAATLRPFAHVAGLDGDDRRESTHAAVGTLRPNAFGLYDMVGNVAEWCQDTFSSLAYVLTPRPGDGLRPVPTMQMRVVRGGTFQDDPRQGASAARHPLAVSTRALYLGLRAARPVQMPVQMPVQTSPPR